MRVNSSQPMDIFLVNVTDETGHTHNVVVGVLPGRTPVLIEFDAVNGWVKGATEVPWLATLVPPKKVMP